MKGVSSFSFGYIIFKNIDIFVGLLHEVALAGYALDTLRIHGQLVESCSAFFKLFAVLLNLFSQQQLFVGQLHATYDAVFVQKADQYCKQQQGNEVFMAPHD